MSQQSLIYSVVAAGKVVLAEFSAGEGNFHVYAKQILNNLPADAEGKKSYPFQGYNFHTMATGGLTYIVVARDTFGVRIPFAFLEDIRVCWLTKFGNRGQTASAYAMNDEFSRQLSQKMEFYSNDTSADKIAAINNQMEMVKLTVLDNLEKTIERGESIKNLLEKSEGLTTTSANFKSKTVILKKKFCRRNVWIWVAISIVAALVLFGIMAAICGGVSFPSCRINSAPTYAPTRAPPLVPTATNVPTTLAPSGSNPPIQPLTAGPTHDPNVPVATDRPTPAVNTPAPTDATPAPTTAQPTAAVTSAPTGPQPTAQPSKPPPTLSPTTVAPTALPTGVTDAPTSLPVTDAPTSQPLTAAPTGEPTFLPTQEPTGEPTQATVPPTTAPTPEVTSAPTGKPSPPPTGGFTFPPVITFAPPTAVIQKRDD